MKTLKHITTEYEHIVFLGLGMAGIMLITYGLAQLFRYQLLLLA
jgi:hypothetical protein